MSLRTRLILGVTAAVAVAVVLVASVSFVTVQNRLHDQLDQNLEDQAQAIARVRRVGDLLLLPQTPQPLRGETQLVQLIGSDGRTSHPSDQPAIPVSSADRSIAAKSTGTHFADATINGTDMRVITIPTVVDGFAVQVARPLRDIKENLHDLRLKLALVAAGGIGLAAALGFLVARAGMRPVRRLTAATEHVAETQDLRASITLRQRGELGRLATSFNAMLDALDQSRAQQRQLVADAGHELRTPLTSLRTNIEVLAAQPRILKAERERLMADVVSELAELSTLVGAVVELAQEDTGPDGEFVELHLDELVTEAVDRARRHAPELTIRLTTLQPTLVRGQEHPIERALTNILDNACKWSPANGTIEVALADHEVTVQDHGPGIDPVDLPHIFDRFYRAPAARPLPGSGLGLSIVRRVMDLHNGAVTIESTQGGGTLVRLAFPPIADDNADNDNDNDNDG